MSSESLEFASAELDQVYTEKCLMAGEGEETPTGELEMGTLPSSTPAGGGDTGGPHTAHTRATTTTAATTSTTEITSPEIEPKYGGDTGPE